jgi:DNA-binding CsgD family transcriptional regulator
MNLPNEAIVEQISKLTSSRERYILELRLGINCERSHTLQEIADRLELTRERVRQIQHSALTKLANKNLNSILLVSELAAPSHKSNQNGLTRAKKYSNALLRSGEKMNMPDQFIVVNFTIPVKGTDPTDGSTFFADRHKIRADWARQDGVETLFMIEGEVKCSWPTSLITRITWPSGIDVPVTPREFENRMQEIKSEFPKAWSKWSYEEEQKLSKLFSQGKNVSEIASTLGRAPGGIYSRLKKMQIIDESTEFSNDLALAWQKPIVTGTVYELVKRLYEISITQNTSNKANKKFNEPGWFLMVDELFLCPTCWKKRILIFRKHWKNMGRVFHRWGITCLECDKLGESREFDTDLINSIHQRLEEFPPVEETCPDCLPA